MTIASTLVSGIAAIWLAADQRPKITLAAPTPTPILTSVPTATPRPTPPSTATPTPIPMPTPEPTVEGDAEAAFTRGYTSYSEEKYNQAISDYSEAIQTKTDYADAYNNRGLAYDHELLAVR